MPHVDVHKLHHLTGHRDCIYTVQPSGSPNIIFSGSGDGMVVLWDLDVPAVGKVIAKLENSIYALHFHAQSKLLVVGHNYDGIHLLNWQTKAEVGSLQLTKAAIFDIQSNNEFIFLATGDGAVIQVDSYSRRIVRSVTLSSKSARTLAVNPVAGELAVGYSDNHIRVLDLDDLSVKYTWQAHDNSVFTVRYSPDRQTLFSGSRDARLKAWNVTAAYAQQAEIVAHMYAINHLEFSPDGKHFVTCSMDKSIKVWDAAELKLMKVIDRARHAGHGTSVNKLLWTNHHNQLVSASDDRTLSVWNLNFEQPSL